MTTWRTCIVLMGCVVGTFSGVVLGDFYDLFADGQYCQDANDPNAFDPNGWDADNPHWRKMILEARTSSSFAVRDGALVLQSSTIFYRWVTSLGVYADSGNGDANTSDTWFDSGQTFYLLSRVTWPAEPNSPNDPNINGAPILGLCMDPNAWGCYGVAYNPRGGELVLGSVAYRSAGLAQLDLADRSDLDPRAGVWILSAHVVELMDANDGNSVRKTLRGAAWNGGKYDWNGQYDVEYTYAEGPNLIPSPGLVLHSEGYCGFVTFGCDGLTSAGAKACVGFGNVECRRGVFSNQSATLSMAVINAGSGTINVEPNLPDANDTDPNMPYTWRYTLGTSVVLTATPNAGKVFEYWQILDPNFPGDPNYGTTDSNSVLFLSMTQNMEVVAYFRCGSGLGALPLLTVLPVLGVWLVWRRRER